MMGSWSGLQSAKRLRLVQNLVAEAEKREGVRDVALLVVPGVDGKYNANSQRLVKYLFLGAAGEELLEPTIGEEHEALEDCVLAIATKGVSVYYGPKARKQMGCLIAQWPGLQEFRLLEGEFGGDAALEERFKIESFIKMLDSHQTVAVPTESAELENHETFPLVQAYGLDELGTGGFLSSQKRIMHLGNALEPLWSHADDVAAQGANAAQLLLQHWSTSLRLVSKQLRERGELDLANPETSAVEPLLSLFDFGSIRVPELCTKAESRTGGSSATLSTDGRRLSVRGEDPASTVRAAREYFVGASQGCGMARLYGALVTAQRTVLEQVALASDRESFAPICDPSRARAERRLQSLAFETLNGAVRAFDSALQLDQDALEVSLETFDLAGQDASRWTSADASVGFEVDALHYLELRLRAPSGEQLCVGDTVVAPRRAQVTNLTVSVPALLSFETAEEAARAANRVEQLGNPAQLRRRTRCSAYFGRNILRANLGRIEGMVSLFEFGFAFEHVGGTEVVDLRAESEPRTLVTWNATKERSADCSIVAVEADDVLSPCLVDLNCGLCSHVGLLAEGHAGLAEAAHSYRDAGLVQFADRSGEAAAERCFLGTDLARAVEGARVSVSAIEESKAAENEASREAGYERLYIVAGPPGAGKQAVAHTMSERLGARLIQNDVIHGAVFDAARLRKQLVKLGASARQVLVVLAPGDTSPEAVWEAISESVEANTRVSAVAVVSPQTAFRDERATNLVPGLLSSCQRGAVHTVVLTGANAIREEEADELQDRLRHWNAEAELFRAGLAEPWNAGVVLNDDFWDHQQRVLKQRRFNPSQAAVVQGEIESRVVLSTEATLSRKRLELALRRLTRPDNFAAVVASAAPQVAPPGGNSENLGGAAANRRPRLGLRAAQELAKQKVLAGKQDGLDLADVIALELPTGYVAAVSGTVVFEQPPEKVFAVSAAHGLVRFKQLTKAEMGRLTRTEASRTLSLVFEGCRLGPAASFEGFVRELQVRALRAAPVAGKSSVSAEEVARISKDLLAGPLPPGFWFDGRSYMDHTGRPLSSHPLLEEKLAEWVAEQNHTAASHNAEVARQERERASAKLSSF